MIAKLLYYENVILCFIHACPDGIVQAGCAEIEVES